MIMSFYYFHHPLYLPRADSLEAQSSRRKFIFPRAGDDARRKAPGLFEAVAWGTYYWLFACKYIVTESILLHA